MDFALILFVLSLVTGVLWALDRFVMRKRRAEGSSEPVWVEWGAGFFPILLAIFLLRSFPRRALQDSLRIDDSDLAGR